MGIPHSLDGQSIECYFACSSNHLNKVTYFAFVAPYMYIENLLNLRKSSSLPLYIFQKKQTHYFEALALNFKLHGPQVRRSGHRAWPMCPNSNNIFNLNFKKSSFLLPYLFKEKIKHGYKVLKTLYQYCEIYRLGSGVQVIWRGQYNHSMKSLKKSSLLPPYIFQKK